MKKKKFLLGSTLVILTVGIGIAAANSYVIMPEKINLRDDIVQTEEYYYSVDDPMYRLLQSIYSGDVLYEKIEEYASYKSINMPTDKVLEKIYTYVDKGFDLGTVLDVCRFWETTNESEDFIDDIMSEYRDEYVNNKYWTEDAFNKLTENKHGVLSREEIHTLIYEDGMDTRDIAAANIISRKGVYTINDIIRLRKREKPWNEIISTVYGIEIDDKYSDVSALDLLDGIFLAKRTNKSLNYFLDNSEEIKTLKNDFAEEKSGVLLDKLEKADIWQLPSDVAAKNAEHENALAEEMSKGNISREQYESLTSCNISD